jgi:capsular polysaccharide transport system permease protein
LAIRAERARRRAERQALRDERLEDPAVRAPEEGKPAQGEAEVPKPAEQVETPAPVLETPEPATPEAFSGAHAHKKRASRARRLALRLLVWVVLPTLVGAYYYYRLASPQYESVSQLTIYSAETLPSGPGGLHALMGLGAGSSVLTDGMAVREYIFSRDMLRRLDTDEGFIKHYADQSKDWFSRLPKDASLEDAFASFEDWVNVEVDPLSGVATLTVRAYTPEAAQRFSKAIIHYAEQMVNELSSRARADEVKYAEQEQEKAEQRLATARKRLVEAQQERGEYNPEMSAQAQMSIRTALESQLAMARAELAQLQAYMTPDAPQVIGAKEKIRALSGQIAGASRRMVAKDEKGQSLNKSVVEFEAIAVEKELATSAYEATTNALMLARASAGRQHRYLATISPPSFADESTRPKRGLGVLTVFVCSLLFMGIGSLLIAGVKEHARL